MFISDLNYLETASEAVTGGFFGYDFTKVSIYQSNNNYTKQDADAKAYSKFYAKAEASNKNETYQSNYIGAVVVK